jgi:hypothetical protein
MIGLPMAFGLRNGMRNDTLAFAVCIFRVYYRSEDRGYIWNENIVLV